jgi:hypothetical protein
MSYLRNEKYSRYLEQISKEFDVTNISVPCPIAEFVVIGAARGA